MPHRQLVFTIPKRLRLVFRHDRRLLGELSRAARENVVEVYRDVPRREDVVPDLIGGIQTFGVPVHFHPHIHAIATDGAFAPDGTFLCLPKVHSDRLLERWQTKVFELLVAAGKIDQQTMDQMRSWPHGGFSVDNSVYLSPGNTAGLERLAEYILRCPFSLARVVRLTDDGSVIHHAEKDHCGRFPGPAGADPRGGPRRNVQVFGVLDVLAEVTQPTCLPAGRQVPDKGEDLVRYQGWYSHRRRGMRAKSRQEGLTEDEAESVTPAESAPIRIDRSALTPQRSADDGPRAGSVSTWARLIRRVHEVDPLIWFQCGGPMKIISFIERRRRDVIERIPRHCGLWEGPLRTPAQPRAPPASAEPDENQPQEFQRVLDPEFL